jgi:hypothetical protein
VGAAEESDVEGALAALSAGAAGALAAALAGAGAGPTSTVGAAGGCDVLLSHPPTKVTTNEAARARRAWRMGYLPYASIGGHVHIRLRSPCALLMRPTLGQNFRARVQLAGNAAVSRE